jgi:hypothetical protein
MYISVLDNDEISSLQAFKVSTLFYIAAHGGRGIRM